MHIGIDCAIITVIESHIFQQKILALGKATGGGRGSG